MTGRVRKVCGTCGSTDVLRDAFVEWDEVEQAWVIQNTFDAAYCETCEGETDIEDITIPDEQKDA